ncbi:MAG: hypothetical protein Q4D73_05150 [Actinomycetaceae bacterium]|nr:hypothetical protein [Actinomycetaceae bacterium]
MEDKKIKLWRFAMILAMIAMIGGSSAWIYFSGGKAIYQSFTSMTETTNAVVTEAKTHYNHTGRSRHYTCNLQYEFTLGWKTYTGPVEGPKYKFGFTCPERGDYVSINYNKDNPQLNSPAFFNYNPIRVGGGLFLLVSSSFTLFVLVFLPRKLFSLRKKKS